MTRFSILLSFVLICTSVLPAQPDLGGDRADKPYFIDATLGAMVVFSYEPTAMYQGALSGGYRLHPHHAVGLEYRRAALDRQYSDQSAGGIGAVYRFTYRGLYASTSLGLALGGQRVEYESLRVYDAPRGGHYQQLTLGYRFRSGILLGATLAGFVNRNFERSTFIFAPDYAEDYVYDVRELPAEAGSFREDGTERSNFPAVTLTAGYAFPKRGRR